MRLGGWTRLGIVASVLWAIGERLSVSQNSRRRDRPSTRICYWTFLVAVQPLAPDLLATRCVGQLHGYADPTAVLAHAPLQDIAHAEIGTDLPHIQIGGRFAPVVRPL